MKAGWQIQPLEKVVTVRNGGTPKSKVEEYWGNEVEWLTPKDMGKMDGIYISETPRKITELGLSKCSAKLVPANSVIMSTRAPIGHLAINTVPMSFNQGCRGMTPSEVLDIKYLFYFLSGKVPELNALGTGTTFKELSSGALKNFPIPLPPPEEQKRIVAILDEAFAGLDRARAHTEANLQNARDLFGSYISSYLDANKNDWDMTTIGEIYDVRDGTHDSPKYVPEGYPLITSKNLSRDGLNYKKVKYISQKDYEAINKRSGVNKGDVLMAMIGTIGNPIVVETDPQFSIKNVALFKMKDGRSGHLLKYYLSSNDVTKKMLSEAKGTTQKFVGLGYLRAFPILLPKIDVEKQVIKKFQKMEYYCRQVESNYEAKLTDLDDLRQSLLQKAFAGELT